MKRYPVVFEESAQSDVRRSYDWVAVCGAREKPNDGSSNYGLQFSSSLALCLKVFHLRRKMTSSQRKFARWLPVVTACCSPLESAKFTCSMLEELTSKAIDDLKLSTAEFTVVLSPLIFRCCLLLSRRMFL